MQDNVSLAQFISDLREKTGLSVTGLAKKSSLPVSVIEDIESGKELFLSSTYRQKLAKALKLNPYEIKPYEKFMDSAFDEIPENVQEIKTLILEGKIENILCPVCGSKLISKIAKMYDLEDNLILHPKAKCSKCPFQIK